MPNLIDLNDPEFLKDRRKSYRDLRTDAPVSWTELDGEMTLVLTRYSDVDAVMKSPQSAVQPGHGQFPGNIGTGPSAEFYKRSLPSIAWLTISFLRTSQRIATPETVHTSFW